MKLFLYALLLLAPIISSAQLPERLVPTGYTHSLKGEEAIIYGKFIQRLGFSSGGFPQEIVIMNTASGEMYSFRVKRTYKSKKENTFCYVIPPGNYVIVKYIWGDSKWWGIAVHHEPVYKDVPWSELSDKRKGGRASLDYAEQFGFTIARNSVNYLGTWHFDQKMAFFTNDSADVKGLMVKYEELSRLVPVINLPE